MTDTLTSPPKCHAFQCPMPAAEGVEFCPAHAAAPPAAVNPTKALRQMDFGLGTESRYLRLPGGLPRSK